MDLQTEESTLPAGQIEWSGLTDVGRFRKNNEDAFLALGLDGEGVYRLGKYGKAPMTTQDYIFAVSDGMGGANAGEFASKIAVEKITRLFPQSFRTAASGFELGFKELLAELFDQIHAELTHLGFCYEELRGMGATLSLCWVRPGWVYFAYVGDNDLPPAGDGRIKQVTIIHVGWMFREGQVSNAGPALRSQPCSRYWVAKINI